MFYLIFFFIAHVISDDLSRDTNEEKLPIAPDLQQSEHCTAKYHHPGKFIVVGVRLLPTAKYKNFAVKGLLHCHGNKET